MEGDRKEVREGERERERERERVGSQKRSSQICLLTNRSSQLCLLHSGTLTEASR
jgi:hypothetical protein